MSPVQTLIQRRQKLAASLNNETILLLAAQPAPRNYTDNTYPFHQDTTFRYYTQLDTPGAALLFRNDGTQELFLPPQNPDDIIWTGPKPANLQLAKNAGFDAVNSTENLPEALKNTENIHYLPPHRAENTINLANLLKIDIENIHTRASEPLQRAVVEQRITKDPDEIRETEEAIELTAKMLQYAQNAIKPGIYESDVYAELIKPANARQRQLAFPAIVTVNGETLHKESMHNILKPGSLVLIDTGVESKQGYCSDITRTYPVTGRFTQKQKDIYDAVLNVQIAAIQFSKQKNITNRQLHDHAAKTLAQNLVLLGLMKGNIDEIVQTAAYALFMPHGIGHLLGLDVHDMENFGDIAGYDHGIKRSTQFGPSAL